jgi:hypothetical protein
MKAISRKKKVLFAIIAVLFGMTAASIVAEFALRIAGPEWLTRQMKSTNLEGALRYGSDAGWPVETVNRRFVRFKPNQEFPVDYYEYHTIVHTDQWGGRAANSARKNNSVLIPVLGDSFAFGLGVKDEETFISQLNTKSEYQYLNLGVPGSALPNQLDIIEFRHKELHSSRVYVFTFYPGNDYTDILKYYGYRKQEEKNLDGSTGLDKLIEVVYNDRFLGRSYLLQFLGRVLARRQEISGIETRGRGMSLSFRTSQGKRIGNSVYLMMSGSADYERVVDKYLEQALQRLVKLSRNLDFKPVFIIIPDKHQVEQKLFQTQAKHYELSTEMLDPVFPDQFFEKKLEKDGIQYVDTFSCLKDRTGYYFKIDDHLTSAGHQAVADCISGELDRKISAFLGRRKQ